MKNALSTPEVIWPPIVSSEDMMTKRAHEYDRYHGCKRKLSVKWGDRVLS